MGTVSVKILGIDPGKSGALAFLNERGHICEIEDMPMLGKAVNAHMLSRLIEGYGPVRAAAVESAHSMPEQGRASIFNYAMGYGMILGVLAALDIPTTFYTATEWKRHFKLTTDKSLSRRRATERWPTHADAFKRVKDDGRAEACFIAAKLIIDNPPRRRIRRLVPVQEMAD